MGHTYIPDLWSWAAGLPPCWVLRRPKGAEKPGLGAREWVQEPGRNWEESGIPRLMVQEQRRILHPWFFSICPERVELPVCLDHPKAAPSQQTDAGSRKEPWSEALSSGGSLPPRRGGAGVRGTPETSSESQQGQC